MVDSYLGVGGVIRGWVLSHSFYLFVLECFILSCPGCFLSEQSMVAVVSVSLFIICFLCLQSLYLGVIGG